MKTRPFTEGQTLLSTGEIAERVTFSPEDASVSSILRSLLESVGWEDVAYTLNTLRPDRQAGGDR